MKLPLLSMLLVAISLMLSSATQADIYKCVAPNGALEFKQTPCDKAEAKEEIVSTKSQKTSGVSKNATTAQKALRIYPGAKQRSKEVEPGFGEFLEYTSTADFNKIVEYYKKQAGAENCEFLQADNFNCSYKKVSGYGSADVYIAQYKEHNLISIMKHPN